MISVVIPNWNGKHHLELCLPTLQRQTMRDFEIIVVDNGSHDGSVAFLREQFPKTRLISLPENRGFSAAVNAGIKAASGDLIALLNNDTEADACWLEELQAAADMHPGISCFASRVLCVPDRGLVDSAGDGYNLCGTAWNFGKGKPDGPFFDQPRAVFGASGAASFYRRAFFDEIGLFDEDFFAYYEDVDLAFRGQLAGKQCRYVPAAKVFHRGGGTMARHSRDNLFYCSRNALWVLAKNFPMPLLLKCAPAIALRYMRHFARYFFRPLLGLSVLHGYAAALAHLPTALRKRPRIQQKRLVPLKNLEDMLRMQENIRFCLRHLASTPALPPVLADDPGAYCHPEKRSDEDFANEESIPLNARSREADSKSSLPNKILRFAQDDNFHHDGPIAASISVVLVHYKTEDLLDSCLQHLYASLLQSGLRYEVFVVDNGSYASKIIRVKEKYPDATWISNPINVGFAKACNQGLRLSQGRYCLLLNPDCMVSVETIGALAQRMEEDSTIGLCGGSHRFPDGQSQPSCHPFPTIGRVIAKQLLLQGHAKYSFDGSMPQDVDQLMGSCVILRRSVMEHIGALDERFFLYMEDVDLCWRAKLSGWRIVFFPEACMEVTHVGGASSRQLPALRYLHSYQSLCRWFRKNKSWPEAMAVAGIGFLGLLPRIGAAALRACFQRAFFIKARPNA